MAAPPATVQTEVASPITPLVISTSDPFTVLSQVMKDGSLVVTPSSIPSFATRGPDVDLSSEGSEDVLEDPDDEPVLKKRISNSYDEESDPLEPEFIGMCLSPFLPFFFVFAKSILPYTYVFVSPLCCNFLLFVCLFPYFAETFEGLGVVANVDMPSAAAPAKPIAPISAVPTAPVSAVPFVPVSTVLTASIFTGLGEFLISSLISFLRVYCS